MSLSLFQVDAFTDRPFAGNPAGVCLLDVPLPEGWMQSVAMEMNLAETAFLLRRADGSFDLRWFTPTVEVDLCGHATLASAHILWECGILERGATARFHTRSGLLMAAREGEWITLDFPSTPAEPVATPPEALAAALGVPLCYAGKSPFDYLVELEDEATVRSLAPDLARLNDLPVRGIIVTSRPGAASAGTYDFISRFFAPAAGVPEDPVTGSAHCCLAPYWSARLGKTAMTAYQASPRGGVVRVALCGDRVHLGGQAVTVVRGTLV